MLAAVVQDAARPFDLDGCLDRVAELTARAAGDGALLVVFPEGFVGGYPQDLTFGAVVGRRSPEGHELFRRYWTSGIEVPGAAVERLGEIASDSGVELVIGVIERDGGTLYCTALIVGAEGQLRGKHRKLMPTAMERLVWGQGDGSTMPVVDTPLGRIGAVICWENYMPLMRTAMYAKGIQLYCAPTADDHPAWTASMRHIAREGRCFVLSACQVLYRDDYPPDMREGLADDRPLMRGGSLIAAPSGELLAEPVYDRPVILMADLDLDEIHRSKFDFDVCGHYSRPDVFELRVDERSRLGVVAG